MNLLTHLTIYNLMASLLIYGSLAYQPRLWLHRMPPEIRSKVPPKTPEENKLFLWVALPFVLLLFAYPIGYVIQEGTNPATSFLVLLAFFAGFAIWDTLVLDILIFCILTPRFIIINGTERGDYSNKKYHLASGAKGLARSAVFSALLALVLTGIA
jgi:hypothetical protein